MSIGFLAERGKYFQGDSSQVFDFLENTSEEVKHLFWDLFAVTDFGETDVPTIVKVDLKKQRVHELVVLLFEGRDRERIFVTGDDFCEHAVLFEDLLGIFFVCGLRFAAVRGSDATIE